MNYKEKYEEARSSGETRDLIPEFMEFRTENEMIVGKYLGSAEMTGKLGNTVYNQYLFETDEKLVKFSMGAMMDGEVKPSMKIGEVYAITFLGKQKIDTGRTVNRFSVEHVPGAGTSRVGGKEDTPL